MMKIIITVEDPLILDYRPGVSNEHETLDYIPASRLRGAFYEAVLRIGTGIDPVRLFGFAGPRWTAGWPAEADGSRWVPLPKCPLSAAVPRQKGKKAGWGLPEAGTLLEREVATEVHMSVGRDYERSAHRHGALYARTSVSPGQHFVAYVDMDENILPESAFEWNLGTRHSANGRCKVTITRTEATFLSLAGDAEDFDGMANCVAIQLLSDAIIPGPCGGYLRGLDDGAIGDLAGCPIEILAGHSSSKVVGGWSGKWNLPRESAIAIEAGSVWLIRFDGGYTDLSANFIEECQVKGLGIRTYEGFGSVAINPDWLLSTHENMEDDLRFRYEAQEALGHIRCMERKGYLGLSSVAPDALSLLIDNAKTTANSITQDWDKTASEARQWITTVARDLLVVDSVFLKEFLNNSKVDKLISEMNENATKRDALIFYLNAFESELKVKQKNKRTAAEPTEEGFA